MSEYTPTAESLLTPQQAAQFLQVSLRTLERWRSLGSGPPVVDLTSRTLRYSERGLLRWLDERHRRDTAA